MSDFTKLEEAALHAIFAETPELASILEQQLAQAAVINRENTGVGFFTTILVADDVPQANGPQILGQTTYAGVEELAHGLGFILFFEHCRLHLLEGYSVGGESTAPLNLADLSFAITDWPSVYPPFCDDQ